MDDCIFGILGFCPDQVKLLYLILSLLLSVWCDRYIAVLWFSGL